jgi:putative transposase
MSKITRFVTWILKKFPKVEIYQIITELLQYFEGQHPDIQFKDKIKEEQPNYRNFFVDPNPPIKFNPAINPQFDYKQLITDYESKCHKKFKPVKQHPNSPSVPESVICPFCNAPHIYLYYNDGKKRTQIKCKVCNQLFQLNQKRNHHPDYYCPHCNHALYKWKQYADYTVFKCGNRKCSHRISSLNKLNPKECESIQKKSSQFKICYQFREYHYKPEQLLLSSPDKPKVDLTRIYNSFNTLGLILTFHVSYALSARKTAHILNNVFNIKVSRQTVLNYAESSAYYCHLFNLKYKGSIDSICSGDETYIKIKGKTNYVFFFISSKSRKIISYHLSDSRDTHPAIISMNEAIRTAGPDQVIKLITDGNPSYQAAILYINSLREHNKIEHHKVIGLQNLDSESTEYREFKQLIERLNRTYKHHVKPAHGFNNSNGAIALTTLFVTHYNFIRDHSSLNYKTPVEIPEIKEIPTIQGKWAKLISMAA